MTNTAWPAIWARLMDEVSSSKLLVFKSGLGRLHFDSRPHVINVATQGLGKEFAQDERHPLHIPLVAKLMDFDHNKLHWKIKTTSRLFYKATIRSHATRKARDGIIRELKLRGYDRDGRIVSSPSGHAPIFHGTKANLKGAMSLDLDHNVLAMPPQAMQVACQDIVDWIMSKQNQKSPPSRRDYDDRYNRPFDLKSYAMARQYLEDLRK